jgi:hypothetical protein
METFGKHKNIWKVIMIIAALSLIAASFLPYITLL